MIKKLFSVYDSKSGVYSAPFMEHSNASGIRAFETGCKDKNTMMFSYPQDYTLFELGTFDDQTAKYELLATPKSLVMAQELVAKESEH